MSALARVGMFVQVSAIEFGEAVRVAGEVGWSPVEEDAQACVMAAVDKLHEFSGRAIAAGGGEVADGLIAPGTVEGMLHDWEQLDVGVAELFYVRNELIA